MVDIPETELRELGRAIADSVVGAGKVADVDVVTMPDGLGGGNPNKAGPEAA
jgi:hypothetical protein